MNDMQLEIANICDQIKDLLLAKNISYGNSALDPVRVFSEASTVEQILVRIDDKLSRIKRGVGLISKDEDVINDLIGYLVILKIALKKEQGRNEEKIKCFYSTDSKDNFNIPRRNPLASVNGYLREDPWDGTDLDNTYEFYFEDFKKACPD